MKTAILEKDYLSQMKKAMAIDIVRNITELNSSWELRRHWLRWNKSHLQQQHQTVSIDNNFALLKAWKKIANSSNINFLKTIIFYRPLATNQHEEQKKRSPKSRNTTNNKETCSYQVTLSTFQIFITTIEGVLTYSKHFALEWSFSAFSS